MPLPCSPCNIFIPASSALSPELPSLSPQTPKAAPCSNAHQHLWFTTLLLWGNRRMEKKSKFRNKQSLHLVSTQQAIPQTSAARLWCFGFRPISQKILTIPTPCPPACPADLSHYALLFNRQSCKRHLFIVLFTGRKFIKHVKNFTRRASPSKKLRSTNWVLPEFGCFMQETRPLQGFIPGRKE